MDPIDVLAEVYERLFFTDLDDAPVSHQNLVNTLATAVEAGTVTLAQAQTSLVNEAKGATGAIAAAYQFLTGEVPSEEGFEFLVSAELSGDFGTFNVENRFINQFNALVQGNPTAAATFNFHVVPDVPGDDDLIASIANFYDAVTNITGTARQEALDYLTRPEALEYYRAVAQERILNGSNPDDLPLDQAAAIVALGAFMNIAVREGVAGLGADIQALLVALAEDNSPLHPTEGTDISGISGVGGQTFTLTEDADQIPGLIGSEGTTDNSGDDTIIAGTSVSGGVAANNLGAGDVIDGGTGRDTLSIIDDAGAVLTPNMSNVEVINAQALFPGGLSINMINVTDAEELWNNRSTSGVEFNNIQEEATVGVRDSNTNSEFNFANMLASGAVSVALEDADASIFVTAPDVSNLTVLNIAASGENYVNIDVDDTPGPGGTTAVFETINVVDGAAGNPDEDDGLELNPGIPGTEFDMVTQVNAETYTGWFSLDLSSNNEDIDFNGGSGDTWLWVGSGDSTIDTGEGDDYVDASIGGTQTINLGAGNDWLNLGGAANVGDTADGGEGDEDTIEIDVDLVATLTGNGDFGANITGFERLYANGVVEDGENFTINLANLDDINYVITEGTEETINEIREYDINSTGGTDFGQFTMDFAPLGGGIVSIQLLAGTSGSGSVAQAIVDAFVAGDFDAIPQILDIRINPADLDNVIFELDGTEGPYPLGPIFSVQDSPFSANVAFNGGASTPGVDEVTEVQTLEVTFGPLLTGLVTLNVNGTIVQPTLTSGQTFAQAAAAIGAAIEDAGILSVSSVDVVGSTVFINYGPGVTPAGQVTFDGGLTVTAATAATPTPYAPPAPETQVYDVVVGNTTVDGRIAIEGVVIEVPEGTTTDGLAGLIIANTSAINTALGGIIDSISYNSGTEQLTVVYLAVAGDVPPLDVDNDNDADVVLAFQGGSYVEAQAGGILNIEYTAPGGTLELDGANEGVTNIIVDGALGSSDEFTIVLANAADHTGVVSIDGIEILNVVTEADAMQSFLGINGPDVVTIYVSGTSGVDFGDPDMANLETVDASALDIAAGEAGVWIETDNVNGTTFIGSAGDDWFIGGAGDDIIMGGAGNNILDGNAGNDTIIGGDGDDFIDGGLGADILTGGAGSDTFFYNNVADSQGVTVDTITDFVSGEDLLDFSPLAALYAGVASYVGEVIGFGAVLTSLSNVNSHAVLDTSTNTLYFDVNGDGVLDDNDMAINLTGVTSLDEADFVFV